MIDVDCEFLAILHLLKSIFLLIVEFAHFLPKARNCARTKFRNNKEHTPRMRGVFFMAAELGFEPRHTESESAVLPLHNSAK